MKIAYVTTYDASNINAWSGTVYYIYQTLKLSGLQIENIGNLREKMTALFRGKKLIYRKLLKQQYLKDREPLILKSYAKQVEETLLRIKPDVVFSLGTIPISHLRTNKPIVFWADATFAGMVDFYPEFSNLCKETLRKGNRMEQEALSRCRLAIYSSEWAAKTAIENYDVNHQKVKVVPFGANIDSERSQEDFKHILASKDFSVCKLLFVGVDWFRKGFDIALKAAELLNGQGIHTELHVAGFTPPFDVPSFVTLHGFISKKTEEGRERLNKLFTEAHFFILPSRAECCAIVFAEASSFGLPSIATNVGGIPSAIRDGINGQTFSIEEGAEKYCEYIMRIRSSKEKYYQLALSSFREYNERLNWSLAGKAVSKLIAEFCF